MAANASMRWAILCSLLYIVGLVVSCSGGGYYYPPSGKNQKTNKTAKKKRSNETVDALTVLGGWPPSPNLTKQWKNWADDYKAKQEQQKAYEEAMRKNMTQAQRDELTKTRGDWPPGWKGLAKTLSTDLGPGSSGEVPPPWGYAPRKTGLPDFCYQWPKRGSCKKSLTRWGFNSFAHRCDKFIYSGCDENQNNFKDKLSCEKACMIPPVSGCDTESQILAAVDYDQVLDSSN